MTTPTVNETTNAGAASRAMPPLLPDRHPTSDFFICDVFDAPPKDDMASMEHPVFSLSTKPDQRILEYHHNGLSVEVVPSVRGLATIFDKDILIYCISQLMAKMKIGEAPKKELHLVAHDLLVATNRETSGDGYRRLKEALERLSGTRITTNIDTGGEEITEGFGLIDSWRIVRKTKQGRMISVKISLSDWLFNAVVGHEVLTLHRNYFRLRKPVERRVYELARKHCGKRDDWTIRLDTLQKKCGSNAPIRVFRGMIRNLVRHDHLPDYSVSMEDDLIRFVNRHTMSEAVDTSDWPVLDPETYHEARIVAPGYDVHFLEKEWVAFWVDNGKPPLRNPDKAFVGFCKRRYERNPNP